MRNKKKEIIWGYEGTFNETNTLLLKMENG